MPNGRDKAIVSKLLFVAADEIVSVSGAYKMLPNSSAREKLLRSQQLTWLMQIAITTNAGEIE